VICKKLSISLRYFHLFGIIIFIYLKRAATPGLQAWLQSGLQIAPPPKDYRCILNEPIWFSRFLIAEERNKHGRFFNKDIECRLVNLGISHLSDLVSLDQSKTGFRWMSSFEAEVKTRSKVLGKAITRLSQ
jgi:hypothetical protein